MLVEKFNPVASLEQGAFELNRLSPLGDAIKRRSDPPFLGEVPSIARRRGLLSYYGYYGAITYYGYYGDSISIASMDS